MINFKWKILLKKPKQLYIDVIVCQETDFEHLLLVESILFTPNPYITIGLPTVRLSNIYEQGNSIYFIDK